MTASSAEISCRSPFSSFARGVTNTGRFKASRRRLLDLQIEQYFQKRGRLAVGQLLSVTIMRLWMFVTVGWVVPPTATLQLMRNRIGWRS